MTNSTFKGSPIVSFRWDGKPVVLGVVFPSIKVAIRDTREALGEHRSLAARARLLSALTTLEAADQDGSVPVPMDALASIR